MSKKQNLVWLRLWHMPDQLVKRKWNRKRSDRVETPLILRGYAVLKNNFAGFEIFLGRSGGQVKYVHVSVLNYNRVYY